uniref:Uncharacterized protein n=1 Tax=Anguilla anguilla TaxID=7936 RepID=A0A0E9WUE3_ANGAN
MAAAILTASSNQNSWYTSILSITSLSECKTAVKLLAAKYTSMVCPCKFLPKALVKDRVFFKTTNVTTNSKSDSASDIR